MLKITEYEVKNIEELEKKLGSDFQESIILDSGEKSGLLSKKAKYNVIKKEDIISYLYEIVTQIGELMQNPIECKISIEDKYIKVNISSENNGIIIGKNGRTLQAIQYILMQIVRKNIGNILKVAVDVGSYREDRQKTLERDIRFIADDVMATRVGVKLEYMNSYERLIVHQVINEYEKLETKSEGEEPQRYINIVYKED